MIVNGAKKLVREDYYKQITAAPFYRNRIEARQWIVARHLSCSLSLSLSLSLSPLYLSFSPLSLSLPPLSLFLSFSPTPIVSLSFSHSCLPFYLSLTPVSPSPSLRLALCLTLSSTPVSLPIFLSPTMPLSLWF